MARKARGTRGTLAAAAFDADTLLFQLLSLGVEVVEPLVEEGEEGFEGGFDEEVKEHKEDIDLRDA